jgi:Septum formation
MADQWKCPRCGTSNSETIVTCTACGQMRGSLVVPGSPPEPVADQALPAPEQPATGAPTDWPAIEMAAPAAPVAKPIWQRIPWGAALFVVVIGGGAIGGLIFNASRSDTGEISKSGDLTAAELRVGDCYDLKDPTAEELEQVTARPCAEEHEYEMIFVGSAPEGTYPDEDAFVAYVGDECIPAFNAFVGTDYYSSTLDIAWLEPTSASWVTGDRSVQCAVYDPEQPRVVGSLKGATR